MLTPFRRSAASVCLGLALAYSLALASCGGDGESPSEPPSQPPAELLAEALAHPAPSGVATVQLNLSLEGPSPLAGASSVALHGPFAFDQPQGLPRFDLALDAEVAGFGIDGDLVTTGEDAFVVFFGENYRVGADRVAAIQPPRLRIDRWFENPHYAGVDDVAGTETERIAATLNSAAAARDLGALARRLGAPTPPRALGAGAGSGPIDAWVALEDRTIRRINLQLPFTVPPAQRAAANGIAGGEVSLDAQISSVGSEATIEPPAGGGFQPIERLIERLGDLASLGGIR